MNYVSLSELSRLIKTVIHSSMQEDYWVTAEIAQISCHFSSGHCYLDLIEKQDDTTAARMKATVWASSFKQISYKFREMAGQDLQSGMKILMLVKVTYHEVHGLSLNVRDIDPRYTLGEMALRRREILERLTKEGIIDKNRQLTLPPVIQRVAVISSVTAAGYGDFLSSLENNPYGYKFVYRLFQAYMQGEKTEKSIIDALRKCLGLREHFDAIVIIRGGGSAIDLHSFDSYPMAHMIVMSPVPVFTGIGHERDETVLDRVAHMRLITPTAVAEYLVARAKQFEERVDELEQRLAIRTNILIEREKQHLRNLTQGFSRHTRYFLRTAADSLRGSIYLLQTRALATLKTPTVNLKVSEGHLRNAADKKLKDSSLKLKECRKTLKVQLDHIISLQLQKIEHYDTKIRLLDPSTILKRGYSIAYCNGKVLRDTDNIRKDDIMKTILHRGTVISIVESSEKDGKHE